MLLPEQAGQWRAIAAAAQASVDRGTAATFIWALPQACRDGFTAFRINGEGAMQAFDDIVFPLGIGREASLSPAFSTQIVESPSGHERRSSDWADARLSFDAGPGVRSEADIATLIGFSGRAGARRGGSGSAIPMTIAAARRGRRRGRSTRGWAWGTGCRPRSS